MKTDSSIFAAACLERFISTPRRWLAGVLPALVLTAATVADAGIVTLHSFGKFNENGTNTGGGKPQAPLAVGADGNLYGTTADGGRFGNGSIFRISPSNGATQTLFSFQDAERRILPDRI